MTSLPIPKAITIPWEDLLAKRALLHEHLKYFSGAEDFVAKTMSSKLSDRRDTAALERFAEEVFNIYVDLGAELLALSDPHERAAIKTLSAELVLIQLCNTKHLSASSFELLDEVRLARNSWQHGASFVPSAAVWRGIVGIEQAIDKALAALQRGFERAGHHLEMDFPDLETSDPRS